MNNVFESANVDLYHLLGLNPGERDQILIKKNFSDLIKVFHSDRGGDSRFHQQIVEAYRILSDPSRKFIYDNFGLFGVYAIKADDELLKIYSNVITSSHLSVTEKEVIKNYVSMKIYKKLNDKYLSQQNDFSSSDISTNMSTGLFDYFYLKNFVENKDLHLGKTIRLNRISFDNNFSLYESEDSNRDLSFNVNTTTDPKDYNTDFSFEFDFNNKIFFPYNLSLFDKNFIDSRIGIEKVITATHSDLIIKKSITVYDLFNQPLNLSLSPNYSLTENTLTGCEVALNFSPVDSSISSKFKYDFIHKSFDFNCSYSKKKFKIISFLNLSPDRFSIGAFHFHNFSSRMSKSNSLFLKQNGLFGSNESTLHWKHFALKLTSSFNIIKKENKFKFNTSLTIGLQFGSFKFGFPIVLASSMNLLSNSLFLTSAVIGNLIIYIRKKWSARKTEHSFILNKLNSKKQEEFNVKNIILFNNKIESEKEKGGLVIKSAFFGEFSKILQIYKSLQLFGDFKNEVDKVFDVKIPLILHMVNSRIGIPKNFLEIEGLYVPDHSNRDNLALAILYNHDYADYTVVLKNDRSEFSLP